MHSKLELLRKDLVGRRTEVKLLVQYVKSHQQQRDNTNDQTPYPKHPSTKTDSSKQLQSERELQSP